MNSWVVRVTNSNEIKKACAKEALSIIRNHSVIGLGGGSTIGYLIEWIKETPDFEVKVVTPSEKTKWLCLKNGIDVLHTETIDHIDLAFDGCDQVDEHLQALKSGGGIHTKEKLIASMADDYILLVDESKYVPKLTFDLPVVLEVLNDAITFVQKKVARLGGRPTMRQSSVKDGFTVSDYGHPLMDVFFDHVSDSDRLEKDLRAIHGVIGTSLFTGVVTKVLVARPGEMKWITKNSEVNS